LEVVQKKLIFKNKDLSDIMVQKNLIFKNEEKLVGVPKKSHF
jgi:hypothetical protein